MATVDFVVVNNGPADRYLMVQGYEHEPVLDMIDDPVFARSNVSFDATGISVYHVPEVDVVAVREKLCSDSQERAYAQRSKKPCYL